MNILVAFNDAYAMPARVMLTSLIENNHCALDIYILYIALSDESIRSMRTLDNDRVTLKFIQMDDGFLDIIPVTNHFSKDAYIRLFAHLYLPECVDKILWLDSDLIINGSICEYYDQSFDGKLFIADKDMDFWDNTEKKKELGMPSEAVYINSGVLLMNLKEIRNRIQKEDIIEYIRENYNKIEYVDQDVFNGLMFKDFKVVDPESKYNYFTRRITPWNKKQVYQEVRVLHYLGGEKPWKKGYKFYGFKIWWRYALQADKNYKELYKNIYFSCWKAIAIRFLRQQIKRYYQIFK